MHISHTLNYRRLIQTIKPKTILKQLSTTLKNSLGQTLLHLEHGHSFSKHHNSFKDGYRLNSLSIKAITLNEIVVDRSLSTEVDSKLTSLSDEFLNRKLSADTFFNKIKELSREIKNLSKSDDQIILDRVIIQKKKLLSVATDVFSKLNDTVEDPLKSVHTFFNAYEKIQHAIEYISKELKNTPKDNEQRYTEYSLMLNDFCHADQQGRDMHAMVVDVADRLKSLRLECSLSKEPDSIEALDRVLSDLESTNNVEILTMARDISMTIESIESTYSRLNSTYHIDQKTNREKIKKIAKDVASGALSPVISPLKSMYKFMSHHSELSGKPKSILENSKEFMTSFGTGIFDQIKHIVTYLAGPIGEGANFLYTHSQTHDLTEALGRRIDDLPNIFRATRRYEGKLDNHDFCDLPPLGGRTHSGKEISEALYDMFRKGDLVSDDGTVNSTLLLTRDIDINFLEVQLTTFVSKAYEKNKQHSSSYIKMSPEEKKAQAQTHSHQLLKNSIEKLKTVSAIKGNLYLASEAQDALDIIKHTAGWIGALSVGVLSIAMPVTLVAIGLVAGSVSLFASSTKVLGGIAHSELSEERHKELFQTIPYERLNSIGKEEYAHSRAHILAIQDQVIDDFTKGSSILVSMTGVPPIFRYVEPKQMVLKISETLSDISDADEYGIEDDETLLKNEIDSRQKAAQGWRVLIHYVKTKHWAK